MIHAIRKFIARQKYKPQFKKDFEEVCSVINRNLIKIFMFSKSSSMYDYITALYTAFTNTEIFEDTCRHTSSDDLVKMMDDNAVQLLNQCDITRADRPMNLEHLYKMMQDFHFIACMNLSKSGTMYVHQINTLLEIIQSNYNDKIYKNAHPHLYD